MILISMLSINGTQDHLSDSEFLVVSVMDKMFKLEI